MRNYILRVTVLSIVFINCFTASFAQSKEVSSKPNIVFVFADQWRGQAMGYAGNKDVITPNLDKLASEGVAFSNATSTYPVCTPFRAMLLTGLYGLKTGMFMNDIPLNPKVNSLGKIVKKEGYNTAYIGKWHVDGNGRSAFIPKERRQGFDYWKVLECSHGYNNSQYWGNDDKLHTWQGYDAAAQTQDAITYIEEQAKNKDPFCLVLSLGPPHAPYRTAPKKFQDLYKNVDIKLRSNVPAALAKKTKSILKGYYAHCSAIDSYVKQLQDAIKRFDIEDNTIFVFTSDHGDMINSHSETKKQRIYTESSNVPFIIKYPALLGKKGQKSDFLLNSLDILPTMLGLSGIDVPTGLDGENITEVILGKKKDTRKASLVTSIQPFGQWSRARGGKEFRGLVTKRYTYAQDLSGGWLLFDNHKDPFQLKNVIDDASYKPITKNLRKLLKKELCRLDDKFLTGAEYVKKWEYPIDSTGTVPYH